jgi:aromatic-L-amino-acid decarboxylase
VFLTHTTVRGAVVLRVAVGAPSTTRAHVERVWALLCENHDWLADDFAEQAAERAREAAARAEEQARLAAEEASRAADAAERPEPDLEALHGAAPAAAPQADDEAPTPLEAPAAQDETAAQAAAQQDLPAPADDEREGNPSTP